MTYNSILAYFNAEIIRKGSNLMKKRVMTLIVSFFALMMFAGCEGETYTKEAAEKYFIKAIVLAYDHDKLAETITSDTAYIVSKKIIEEQSYRNKVIKNEKFFNKRFGNTRRYEQELNRGLVCVAKYYFDYEELKEMLKRVRTGVKNEKKSSYKSLTRKLGSHYYKIKKRIDKLFQ